MVMPSPTANIDNLPTLQECMREACKQLAPSWPLDRSIAVNPWWEMRGQEFSKVATKLKVLGNINCLMPAAYYKAHWGNLITESHLEMAKVAMQIDASHAQLLEALELSAPTTVWMSFMDFLDAMPAQRSKMAWHAEVQQQISQFCGAYFQYPERVSDNASKEHSFFKAWREIVSLDKGIGIVMGARDINKQLDVLPTTVSGVFAAFHEEVLGDQPPREGFSDYALSLLLDINGWASWLAYHAWQDGLQNKDNDLIEQLLAVRLAWELLLHRHMQKSAPETLALIKPQFLNQFEKLENEYADTHSEQKMLWVWQRALEFAYQVPLNEQLVNAKAAVQTSPFVQAAFCIDVRSEPMRRALEAQDGAIQTLGFAGFFGLPIEYSDSFTKEARPQLPGLLNPAIKVSQALVTPTMIDRHTGFQREVADQDAIGTAPASFGLVEAGGLLKAFELLKNSFLRGKAFNPNATVQGDSAWVLHSAGQPLDLDVQTNLAMGILKALGLTSGFANYVILIGHGSDTSNNPHAASLECGACGGQSGEVNVRVLAQLLNDKTIRQRLVNNDIKIPESTRFVPALHNTCTDEIVCYSAVENVQISQWLKDAQKQAQQSRAESLGISALEKPSRMAKLFAMRGQDWAQLRPEWGLANNASFIVAPRRLTRNLDLEGRSFLHDYVWESDEGFKTLELIMTAPMIVTNWINLQYYASVVDTTKYGSGNKMLHNVVGEHIGVFEGNGGDLRVGLPIQSVHDGEAWRHQPLRLSVYIVAPRVAIERIVNAHLAVKQLLDNGWLYLFAWDSEKQEIALYEKGQWKRAAVGGDGNE